MLWGRHRPTPTPPVTVLAIKTRQMQSLARAPFTQVLIQGRGVVAHALVAPLPISILMCEMGLLATIGAVGILLIALVKRVKPPFGSNKDSFRTVSS